MYGGYRRRGCEIVSQPAATIIGPLAKIQKLATAALTHPSLLRMESRFPFRYSVDELGRELLEAVLSALPEIVATVELAQRCATLEQIKNEWDQAVYKIVDSHPDLFFRTLAKHPELSGHPDVMKLIARVTNSGTPPKTETPS